MSSYFSTSSAGAGDLAAGNGHQVWREFAPRNQVTGDSSSAVHTPAAANYQTGKLCYFFPRARTPKTPCSAHDGIPEAGGRTEKGQV